MEEKDLTLRRHTPLSINIGLAFVKVLKTYEKAKKILIAQSERVKMKNNEK